MKEMDTMSVL